MVARRRENYTNMKKIKLTPNQMKEAKRQITDKATKARWKNKTTEEKRKHAMMMVEARRKKGVDKSII